MNAVRDGWVRDVVSVDTHNSTTFGSTVRRVTIDNVHIQHTMPFTAPAAPADFAISGTQILLDRSSVTGQGVWPVVTQVGVTGPNVVLNFRSTTAGIAPHQRWAAGLARRQQRVHRRHRSRPNIAFSNREYAGSGHGWSVGWAVAWNVKAEVLLDSAAARLEELVHRMHRDASRRFSGTADRFRFRRARPRRTSLRRSGDASQPVSCATARSTRRTALKNIGR